MTDSPSHRPVALVTGGARGIGAAVVVSLAEAGYRVCFTYRRDHDAAAQLVHRIGTDRGRAVCADVADPALVGSVLDAAASLGEVTVLVNNAGTTQRIAPFGDWSDEDLARVMEVNAMAPMRLCRAVLHHWRGRSTDGQPGEGGEGAVPARSVVNITSVAAVTGAPGEYVPYAAAKAALATFTRGLAAEIAGEGIRVNAVAPGTTDTTIHAAAGDPGRPGRVAATVPMGRVADPAEIAAAVAWLVSPAASYVTGTTLSVAGGA
jgi:NAD(P)-dependent dehydrogenase (short-subunit alcohol dehydrogenase family)